MRIISKFKDYYDYLQGIYGIDEKLILDRTEYTPMVYKPSGLSYSEIIIGDYLIHGLWYNDNIYYGEEIETLNIITFDKRFYQSVDDKKDYYLIKHGNFGYLKILKEPMLLTDSPAYIHNCPILIKNWDGYKKNPILKEYLLNKVYSPFEIWLLLSEFLGKLNTNYIQSIQSNTEKIISHGFDLKTSFRNIK